MRRLLLEEFAESLEEAKQKEHNLARNISLATGKLAYPYICQMANQLMEAFEGLKIQVYSIRNEFFGEQITVSGLLTGQDIRNQWICS